MKKMLLLSLTIFSAAALNAQSCTPGANFADSSYGTWPDTIQNFPPGLVNVFYSTDLNFKVPDAVTADVAGSNPTVQAFIGSPIEEFTVTGVQGLPAGFDYACNVSSCTYPGGSNGCANLYGTGSATGTFPITIAVDAVVLVTLVPGFPPQAVTQSTTFKGYKLVLGTAGTIEEVIEPFSVHPNPASTKVTLEGLSDKLNVTGIAVTNMEGKLIRTLDYTSGKSVDIDVAPFKSGVYFITIQHETGEETVKFVKD